MKKQRKVFWVVAFAALFGFSLMTIGNVTGRGVHVAYARTIIDNPALASQAAFILPNAELTSQSGFGHVVANLTRRAERSRELCGLNEEQQQFLAARYPMTQENVRVGNRTVSVLRFAENGLSQSDMRTAFTHAGFPNFHCTAFQVYDQIILLFSAHVS